MANRLQHLRGSEAEHSTFTGAKGEISLVTNTSAEDPQLDEQGNLTNVTWLSL